MARRYIGDAVVTVQVDDSSISMGPRVSYKGSVRAGGYTWKFSDLSLPIYRQAADSPDMYDSAAASAVSFGGYYTTYNRGDDTPDWAPPAHVADAIDESTSFETDDQGRYLVKRSLKGGKGRWTS